MYSVQANIHGAEIRHAPLRPDFSPDLEAVRRVSDRHSKLLFLCSPNNPTGQCLPAEFVHAALEQFPGLVVLDEAYADFSGQPSWVAALREHPRLVVLQTLSKAWGLAGLRVGMAYANEMIISTLNKIKYPYNLSAKTAELALEALQDEASVRERVAAILAERRRLEAELPRLACVRELFPSDANFLLLRVGDADGLYRHLAANGIIVRNRSREQHCHNCLRITVGTPAENRRLVEVMGAFGEKR
jgi:histidinol-phosphate aminotransferase